MKARTMVYLEPGDHRALKAEAKRLGISLAELMRRLVHEHLQRHDILPPVPKSVYLKIVGLGASGRGDIYSYVVGYEPFLPAFRDLLPHIMVLVQLAEGPRLVGYMVNCTPERMAFGMKVRVVFKRLTDTVTLPVWEPD